MSSRRKVRHRPATDPVVKYDGAGQPVRASEAGMSRAERRATARAAAARPPVLRLTVHADEQVELSTLLAAPTAAGVLRRIADQLDAAQRPEADRG